MSATPVNDGEASKSTAGGAEPARSAGSGGALIRPAVHAASNEAAVAISRTARPPNLQPRLQPGEDGTGTNVTGCRKR